MDKDNLYWDRIAEDYADEILSIQPEFYKNSAQLINASLKGCNDVADIGNGGVINYNISQLRRLDCIDLSLSQKAINRYEKISNVHFKSGNIMDLCSISDCTYDAVIVQAVIHHLAGSTLKQTHKNVEQALKECMRILKPGGKLLIVESTVVPWFECIEKVFYRPMQLFFRLVKFDSVYQFSNTSLIAFIRGLNLPLVHTCEIPLDKYIWLMKHKVLTKLTPCRAVWVELNSENMQTSDCES